MRGYDFVWCHVPNESKHKVQYRVKQARMGLKSGWPDITIIAGERATLIELKSKVGTLSDEQKRIIPRLERASGNKVPVIKVPFAHDAINAIRAHLTEFFGKINYPTNVL